MPYKTYTARGSSRTSKQPAEPTPVKPETVAQPPAAEPVKAEDVDMENGQKKSFFARLKEGGVHKKVPKSVQKKRNNYRLRRLVAPKAPLTVLNELIGTPESGAVSYTFVEDGGQTSMPNMPHLFTAQAEVYGETYTGTGPSKAIAKNICAEAAIQAIVAKKCFEKKIKMEEGDEENEKPKNEDETPWASLASLALFKLFNDWQAQGYQLPEDLVKTPALTSAKLQQPDGAQNIQEKSKHNAAKAIPTNPTEKHPVQLLNELNGGMEYELVGEEGDLPTGKVFTMMCIVKDQNFTGTGKNKKEAKKQAAIAALAAVYDINYPKIDV